MLVLGLAVAILALIGPGGEGPNERKEGLGTFETARRARQPIWMVFLNPFVGVAGVMIGAKLGGRAPAG